MATDFQLAGPLSGNKPDEIGAGPRRDPQLTAWVVLWISFAAFWVLVFGSFLAAKHYYDTASTPRSATLSLEQGIVLFRDAVSSILINAHDNLSIREGDELLLGQGARASVSLFDGSSIRLYSGSELRLTEMRRSRFHDGFARVGVRLAKGTARIDIAEAQTATERFLVATPHGSALLSAGNFGLDVTQEKTRLSSRAGSASVPTGDGVVEVVAGQKALLTANGVEGPLPEGDHLVANGDFSSGFAQWSLLDVNEPGRYLEPGQRMLVTESIHGRESIALRFHRVSQRSTHNETGLIQTLNKDVLDYRSLTLRADVRVDEQSLSGGGYMGYEYPIMIRARYRDAADVQTDWTVGFFHKNPENRPTPNGEGVAQGQWVSFSFDLMDANPKPAYLISLEVLGAGHSFDGMIANVELVGR